MTSGLGRPDDVLKMATEIVAAYVSNNSLPMSEVPAMIKAVHLALGGLNGSVPDTASAPKPAVSPKKSITDDYLICLEDGKKLKMLKRYLRTSFDLSPEEYRAKWGLPPDYPMVAPNYAARRSEFAKQIGLGKTHASRGRRRS